jgi:hypothetical protein
MMYDVNFMRGFPKKISYVINSGGLYILYGVVLYRIYYINSIQWPLYMVYYNSIYIYEWYTTNSILRPLLRHHVMSNTFILY